MMKFEHRVVKCAVSQLPEILGLRAPDQDVRNSKPIGLVGWRVASTVVKPDGSEVILILERELD